MRNGALSTSLLEPGGRRAGEAADKRVDMTRSVSEMQDARRIGHNLARPRYPHEERTFLDPWPLACSVLFFTPTACGVFTAPGRICSGGRRPMIEKNVRCGARTAPVDQDDVQGIVITDVWGAEDANGVPRISAFIWGGKVRPSPTLRFGRWKGAA